MTIGQLIALAASGEAETLELKEMTGTLREAALTMCAFLNQRAGGYCSVWHRTEQWLGNRSARAP